MGPATGLEDPQQLVNILVKSGVNAINLQELLGLASYHTAWRRLQKLRCYTFRKDREKLSGNEVDRRLSIKYL